MNKPRTANVLPMMQAPEAPTAPPAPLAPAASKVDADAFLLDDHDHPHGEQLEGAYFGTRFASLLAVALPFIGLIAAIYHWWGTGFTWLHASLLTGGYILTAIGVTVGYHRYFTHKSFQTNAAVKLALGILGSMSLEGPVIRWVATHRQHHQHTDREHDPHTPHAHGKGIWNRFRGALHSHVGWLFAPAVPESDIQRYAPDLIKDPVTSWVDKTFGIWVLLGVLIPAAIAWAVTGTISGAILGFVWGGLVRIFIVHHVTWSINSVCHLWGTRPYETHDHSRDNALFGVLALGEGWHNTHHAFPASARQGLKWWQPDVSYYIIWTLGKLGLARDIRVPDAARVEAKRRRAA